MNNTSNFTTYNQRNRSMVAPNGPEAFLDGRSATNLEEDYDDNLIL